MGFKLQQRRHKKMFDLIPWREGRQLGQLRREMDTLFDRFFEGWAFRGAETGKWMPALDLSESGKEVTVKAEIPGMDPKDIDISLKGNVLTLRGERKQETEERDENFHRVERAYGAFSRSITLSADVDANKVKASYKDGILKIQMPKTREESVKRIEVKTA
jgi:HSP20 family protein